VLATQLFAAEPSADYTTAHTPFIEVLVDCPGVEKLFVYEIPEDLEVEVGDILSVPFGAQQVGAIAVRFVMEASLEVDRSRVKAIEDVITRGLFPPSYWSLIDRVATYYCAPLMQTIRAALPPGLLQKSQRRLRLNRDRLPSGLNSSAINPSGLNPAEFVSQPERQILHLFETGKSDSYTDRYLRQKVRGAGKAIRKLRQRGWLDSYLEAPKANRPQSKLAVVLTGGDRSELTPRQQELLTILERRGGELWLTDLVQQARASRGTVNKLAAAGCVTIAEREFLRQESSPIPQRDSAKTLTPDQQAAINRLIAARGFESFLLHGVTGSGKTEVYLQMIAPVIDRGQSALVLVPEIGLTPQLTDRFRARFGDRVRVYHSGLSSGERFDTWRQMLTGEPQVVIGTRSAVFAPLPNLGAIILDEEHDSSFKQDQPAPTYHARTVATWRAQLEPCPIVLGSATPSLETWIEHVGDSLTPKQFPEQSHEQSHEQFPPRSTHSATYLSMPRRVRDRPMPIVRVVDLRNELQLGNRSIFSRPLQNALRDLKTTGKQGILFIHRRGHSSFVSCRSCGEVLDCPRCDVSLSYHHTHDQATPTLRCHYCNHQQIQPNACPTCGSPYLKFFGSGTQRVIRELDRLFPDLRAIRFDSDTMRRKGAHRAAIARFAAGEADVLVGTQMLTKGLDLPSVSLVGIVAADGLLGMSHYWAAERAFQTLTQVAGRAGRGDDRGQAILQTYQPEHPVVRAVMHHDYRAFIPEELATRRELGYPPFGRLAIVRVSGVDGAMVQACIERLANVLAADFGITRTAGIVGVPISPPLESTDRPRVELLGPSPAPIERIADRFRWQILLKFPREATIAINLDQLRAIAPNSVSVELDIDPLQLG
jgi:primosomal protein N' (replication factor Y)